MALRHEPSLPIEAARRTFERALGGGRVVLTSPTGSGKSTQVPRWLADRRTVVVEPRRVACRTLAARVASLEGVQLGDTVGYAVRDDRQISSRTRLSFVT
ncbi:MAG: ATP-dependent RNA helicase, partial [Myxococcota bacterium]